MATKIIIYEDNRIFRKYLTELIQSQKELILVGAFPNCSRILEQAASLEPDVVLMDIELPGINGIEATLMLKEKFPDIDVMILSGHGDDDNVFNAIKAGVNGYILKETKNKKILKAVREIHRGGAPMTPRIARKALEFFRDRTDKKEKLKLTKREFMILEMLRQGDPYKMVASKLDIQMGTVQVHIKNIYKKLAVHSRYDAVSKVFR